MSLRTLFTYLSCSCPVTRKDLSLLCHLNQSSATDLTFNQLPTPSDSSHFSVIRLQVNMGLPLFLLPSGAHVSAIAGILAEGILSIWPIHLHFLLLM
ncbi:hypothetical protein CDAR_292941 [Caerostris darwini]|uniref:Uncharacterized protein n=1 Tax=Caerostris darwini TaxID=1538125 RepID=A0AAV4TMK9_9ARAC|nr:hypothetical protein CDAR_292941 [Caerostris darwini]